MQPYNFTRKVSQVAPCVSICSMASKRGWLSENCEESIDQTILIDERPDTRPAVNCPNDSPLRQTFSTNKG